MSWPLTKTLAATWEGADFERQLLFTKVPDPPLWDSPHRTTHGTAHAIRAPKPTAAVAATPMEGPVASSIALKSSGFGGRGWAGGGRADGLPDGEGSGSTREREAPFQCRAGEWGVSHIGWQHFRTRRRSETSPRGNFWAPGTVGAQHVARRRPR